MKRVLVQLLGGQTQPNIFSVLSVAPDEVVNIYTDTTDEQRASIEGWFELHGNSFGITPRMTALKIDEKRQPETMAPVMKKELQRTLGEESVQIILNMTGGTKPMAVVAVQMCLSLEYSKIAQEHHIAVPIFYVNTKEKRFDFLSHAEMSESVLKHEPFSNKLSVQQIVEMGNMRVVEHNGQWEIVYPAATLLATMASKFVIADKFNVNERLDNLKRVSGVPITEWGNYTIDGLPDMRSRIESFVKSASEKNNVIAGMQYCGFDYRDGNFYLSRKKVEEYERIKSAQPEKARRIFTQLQSAQNFLVGGWWEVLVAHALKQQKQYVSILWSVETLPITLAGSTGARPIETDILASNGVSLCSVSCKRGFRPHHMTEELEQHYRRSELLGGLMTERVLAVNVNEDHKNADKIKDMALALQLKVFWRNTVQDMERGNEVRATTPKELVTQFQTYTSSAPTSQSGSAQSKASSSHPAEEKEKMSSVRSRVCAAFRLLCTGRIS